MLVREVELPHSLRAVTPSTESTVIQALCQGESLTWLKLSPGNTSVKQPRSCTQIQLLWEWALTVPLAAARRFRYLTSYTMNWKHLLHAWCSWYTQQSFLQHPLHGAAFWGYLKNSAFAENIIKCHFLESAWFSRSMIYCSGFTLPNDTWSFCLKREEPRNSELFSPFPATTQPSLKSQ